MAVFYCKSCGQKMRAAANVAGRQCRCKACNAMATIPADDEVPPVNAALAGDDPPLPGEEEPPPLPARAENGGTRDDEAPPLPNDSEWSPQPSPKRQKVPVQPGADATTTDRARSPYLLAAIITVIVLVGGGVGYAAWHRTAGLSVSNSVADDHRELSRDQPGKNKSKEKSPSFDFSDTSQPNFSERGAEAFKLEVDKRIHDYGESPFEAAANVQALLGRQGDYDKLLATDPRFNSRAIGKNRSNSTFGDNRSMPGTPTASADAVENLTADDYLKHIQADFDSVDIADPEYAAKRYALFRKLVNENIRLKGARPHEALTYVRAVTRANAYADKCEAEMEKENPDVFKSNLNKLPAQPDNASLTAQTKPNVENPNSAKTTDTASAPKTSKEPAKSPKPPMLNGHASVMRNYITMKDVPHAKNYAKKIIDEFPNTPEADEAKTILQMKE